MPENDIALVGGRIRTLDDADSVAEAVLIRQGRVAALGTTRDVSDRITAGTTVVDLRGRTVLPGLIDAHTHLELSTLVERHWLDVRFVDPETTAQRVGAAASASGAGEWIVGQGTFGQPLPTRARLDEVAPENPVVIRQSMHFQVANSAALQAAGIDRSYVPRNGIRVGRTDTGEATGEVEEGFDLFPIPYPPLDWYLAALPAQTLESWVRHGVTTVHELPATPTAIAAWQRLDAAARMPCRITLNPILAPGHQATVYAIDDYLRLGMQTGFGSEWLKFGAVKLFLDGAGRAAWSRDQLTRSPGAWGLPCFSFNELVAILTACRRSGVQVWMHAVGDVAQWLAIDAVEAVNRVLGRDDHRTRVEHIGNDGSDLAQLPRLVEAGIVPVPTAAFMYGNMTGPEDDGLVAVERRAYPYRTLLEHGLHAPGNSDTAGTQPFATNPWYGVRCMVARRNKDGAAVAPAEEAIDVAAAVRTYTRDGAYVAFEERVKGSVEIGKLGDLGVYPEDPLEMSPEDLPSIVTDLTLVGGRVVHGDG